MEVIKDHSFAMQIVPCTCISSLMIFNFLILVTFMKKKHFFPYQKHLCFLKNCLHFLHLRLLGLNIATFILKVPSKTRAEVITASIIFIIKINDRELIFDTIYYESIYKILGNVPCNLLAFSNIPQSIFWVP